MHVGLMMDWLKTSRLLVDINHTDSWVDKIGYSALSAEVADRYSDIGRVYPDAQPEEVEEEPSPWYSPSALVKDRSKVISRAELAAELEPGLNALFGTEYEPYVEPKTCQKIDGRNGKPCGLPLVGRQKKFCSKHVPKSTKSARKAYGKRSKRQVNYQLS
tara:strand:- start:149 stop:628 length:480 start_codon:yes stop_codon:yes gene_type:complete